MGCDTDLLAIEAFSWTPHLETAGEICIGEVLSGRTAAFVYLDLDNPDVELPLRTRLLGGRARRKVAALQRLISQRRVTVLPEPRLAIDARRDAARFGKQSVGSIDELRGLLYKDAALGMGVASSLISRTDDSCPDVAAYRRLVARYLEASALAFEAARSLILEYRPKAVLLFNGRFACSKAIVEAARQLGVRCLFHERGATFQRYKIFDRPVHDFAHVRQRIREAWATPDSNRDPIGRAFFERRREGDGIGWTSFVAGQVRNEVPARSKAVRYVYFSSSDDEYAAVGDLVEHPLFESQRDAVRFLVDWIARRTDAELVIRVHPHLQRKSARDQQWWHGLRGANIRIESAASGTDSYALAESADVVLAYGSTMGVESAYLGKPVILLGDSTYRGFQCAYEPGTTAELVDLLARPGLEPKPVENCLPFGYYFLTHGQDYRFYHPTSLFRGTFCGQELSVEPQIVRRAKASRIGMALRRLKGRLGTPSGI